MLANLIRSPAITPVAREVRDQAFANTDAVLSRLAAVGCLNFQHPSSHAQYTQGQPFCIQRNEILAADGEFAGSVNLQRAELQTRAYTPINVDNDYPHFVQYVNDLLSWNMVTRCSATASPSTPHSTRAFRMSPRTRCASS